MISFPSPTRRNCFFYFDDCRNKSNTVRSAGGGSRACCGVQRRVLFHYFCNVFSSRVREYDYDVFTKSNSFLGRLIFLSTSASSTYTGPKRPRLLFPFCSRSSNLSPIQIRSANGYWVKNFSSFFHRVPSFCSRALNVLRSTSGYKRSRRRSLQ